MDDNEALEKLKYPIGKFNKRAMEAPEYLERSIFSIETLPLKLQNTVTRLNEQQLDTPYREGGWTVRQVVHHLPDSHINAYMRFKWTLTEDLPLIKAYHEDRWALLPDYKAPVHFAFNLLASLHERWVFLMRSLTMDEWNKGFIHPETKQEIKLLEMAGMYAWHGEHHLAHVRALIDRNGWKNAP